MSHPVRGLDELVHQRVRLGILAVLTETKRADFTGTGVDRLWAEIDTAADGTVASCTIVRGTPPGDPQRRHRIGVGLYDRQAAGLRRRTTVMVDVDGSRTGVPELTGARTPDLVVVNDGDLTYAETCFDERSLETLAAHGGALEHPVTEALCQAAGPPDQ